MLASVLKPLLISLLSEKVLTTLFFAVGEYVASKTTNDVDNKIIAEWKKAYESSRG